MTNRIFKWWDDVQKWKDRFEKMFPPWFVASKEFQKAELAKLRNVLHTRVGKLSEEETLSRKILLGYYNKLEKQIYPTISSRLVARAANLIQQKKKIMVQKFMKRKSDRKKVTSPDSSEVTKMINDFEQSNKIALQQSRLSKQAHKLDQMESGTGKIIEFPKSSLKNNGKKRRL